MRRECIALRSCIDVRLLGFENTKEFVERPLFLRPLLLGDRAGGEQTIDVLAATLRRPTDRVLGFFALGLHPAHDA